MFVDIYAQAKRTLSRPKSDKDLEDIQKKYGNYRFNKNSGTKKQSSQSEKRSTKSGGGSETSSSSKGKKRTVVEPIEEMDTDTEIDIFLEEDGPIMMKTTLPKLRSKTKSSTVPKKSRPQPPTIPTKISKPSTSSVNNNVCTIDSSSEEDSQGPDALLKEFDEFSRNLNLPSNNTPVLANTGHRPPTTRNPPSVSVHNGYSPKVFEIDEDILEVISPPVTATPSPNLDLSFELGKMRIRIKFQDKLFQISGNSSWDVEKVRENLSKSTNIPSCELLIYNEKEQKMEDGKTLKYYNILGGDVLEAIRKSGEKITTAVPLEKRAGVITLKFQKQGLKRPISLNVLEKDSFREIRTRLAKELNVDPKLLSFRLDGETIDLDETPKERDLEDEDAIDVMEASS